MWAQILYGIGAFVLAVFVYGLRPKNRWHHRNYPGPKLDWLLGNAGAVTIENHDAFKDWYDKFGPNPFSVTLAADSVLVMANPSDARKAITQNASRPTALAQEPLVPIKPENNPLEMILWASGEKWKALRASWQPVFFTSSLKNYLGIMDKGAKLLVEEMSWHSSGNFFEVHTMIQNMALSIIGQCAFGIELKTQKADRTEQTDTEKDRRTRLLEGSQMYVEPVGASIWILLSKAFPFLVPILAPLAQLFPDNLLVRYKKGRHMLQSVVAEMFADYINEIGTEGLKRPDVKEGSENTPVNGDLNGTKTQPTISNGHKQKPSSSLGVMPGSFIDLLARGGIKDQPQNLSPNAKNQQIQGMLVAGYETTANTLSFTLYFLSQACHSAKQAKLIEEIDASGIGPTLNFEDIDGKLPYLDACLKESLRLLPTAHLLIRNTAEKQNYSGYDVSKGDWLAVSVFAIHHDRRIWGDNVEEYVPERWLTNKKEAERDMKNSFFAFGGGPRHCPGERFAFLEAKITLVRIFQNFTLRLGPHQEPLALRSSITLAPKDGVYISAQPRS